MDRSISKTEKGYDATLDANESGNDGKTAALDKLDAKAETRLRRKIDFYVVPTVAMLYLFCFIDRAAVGNARLAGFEEDLDLKGFDFNVVLSSFYVGYIVFEIPANLLNKWIGPG